MAELKRTLKLWELVFFASGVILGAGIYAIMGKAAGFSGNMLWLSFVIASLTAGLSLFAYAEISSMYPSSGGEYTYVKESIGKKWAYVAGAMVCLSGIISSATISIGFAGYFSELTEVPKMPVALAIIGFILAVNIAGIKHSSVMNVIFTILETGGLIFVIYSAAPAVGKVNLLELPPENIAGIFTGAAICFFAFTGFEDTVKLADETVKPEKNIPRALFISGHIVLVIYLALSIVVISMVPFEEFSKADSPLSVVVEKRFGHTGAIVIAIVALFSTSNSLLSNMLGASRVLYNIGKDSKVMKVFAFVSPKRKTPITALLLAAGIAAAVSLIGDIKYVALLTNFFVFISFLIMNVLVIYLRLKKRDQERPFKIPGSIRNVPLISVVAIVLLIVMICFTLYGISQGIT